MVDEHLVTRSTTRTNEFIDLLASNFELPELIDYLEAVKAFVDNELEKAKEVA